MPHTSLAALNGSSFIGIATFFTSVAVCAKLATTAIVKESPKKLKGPLLGLIPGGTPPTELQGHDEVIEYYCHDVGTPAWDEQADAVDKRDENTPDAWVQRHPELIRLTGRHPFNCEPDLTKLFEKGFITPQTLHYVRTHGSTPKAKWEDWTCHVGGQAPKELHLSMSDIIALPRASFPVTLVCCGNRRKEQNMISQTIGFNWGAAGVSTCVWTGVRLVDILHAAGITRLEDFPPGMHVRFASEPGCGGDDLPNGIYGTSVPLVKALDPSSDILIAYMCNGELLQADHGFPLRIIVPGYIGGRMIKWLTHIDLLPEESSDYYHYYDNRVFPPHVTAEIAKSEDWWHRPEYICNDLSVNSVIARPEHNEELVIDTDTCNSEPGQSSESGTYAMGGYAYAGGGRKITRAEVSLDGGWHWKLANITYTEKPTKHLKYWCWCFWELKVAYADLANPEVAEICLRAFDEGFNSQPAKPTWNLMGMLNNPWFRIKVHRVTDPSSNTFTLKFEHPTMAGAQPGGWMVPLKDDPILTHPDQFNPHHVGAEGASALTTSIEVGAATTTVVSTVYELPLDIKLPLYTLQEVELMGSGTGETPVWIVVRDRVFDCTPFLAAHPGGAQSIKINAGMDCTEDFEAVHSKKAWQMLEDYYIGNLKPDDATSLTTSTTATTTTSTTGGVGVVEQTSESLVALNPKKKIPFTLIERHVLSSDSLRLRFALQSPKHKLGLPIGHHMFFSAKVDGKAVMRAYTPTSSDDDLGFFDLVIKVYYKTQAFPNGGLMSQCLGSLKIGDTIDVKGPLGHVTYHGKGSLQVGENMCQVKQLSMLAGGTGITPMYQIMKAVLEGCNVLTSEDKDKGYKDKTEIFLLYANRTEDDILLKPEIDAMILAHPNRLHVQYVLSQPKTEIPKQSPVLTGRVNLGMVQKFLPGGGGRGEGVFGLLCGPEGFLDHACTPALLAHGYAKDTLVYF